MYKNNNFINQSRFVLLGSFIFFGAFFITVDSAKAYCVPPAAASSCSSSAIPSLCRVAYCLISHPDECVCPVATPAPEPAPTPTPAPVPTPEPTPAPVVVYVPANSSCAPGQTFYSVCRTFYCVLHIYDPECGFVAPAPAPTPTPSPETPTPSPAPQEPVDSRCDETFYHLLHSSECNTPTPTRVPVVDGESDIDELKRLKTSRTEQNILTQEQIINELKELKRSRKNPE